MIRRPPRSTRTDTRFPYTTLFRSGEIRFWDSPANVHEGGILRASSLPPPQIILDQQPEARALMAKIAAALDYVGVLTGDRKCVVWGKSVTVRVDLGGRRIIKKKTK